MATLESSIRIGAVVDQAVGALRSLKKEVTDLNQAASKPTSGSAPGAGLAPAITKSGKDAETAAAKAARDLQRQLDRDHAAALREDARRAGEKVRVERQAAAAIDKARRQSANQARMLAPQLTDISVGLATGQSPLMVLLQQGGQLRDIYGGVGNAARALISVLTPLRLIVGGVATGIGAFVLALTQGWRESDRLTKAIETTGNVADVTAGSIDASARTIAARQNAAIGDVRATMAALVASGSYTRTSLDSTARAVIALSKVTGESAEDAMKAFDGQADGVAAWAAKANKAYNFLTGEQYRYIRSLEAQGRTQEAIRVVNDALSSQLEQRMPAAVGSLERAWATVGTTLSKVWDTLKSIGRDTTAEEKVTELARKLDALRARQAMEAKGGLGRQLLGVLGAENAEIARVQAELAAAMRELQRRGEETRARAAAAAKAQEDIRNQSKEFEAGLLQVNQAALQKQLAQRLAALDGERAMVEEANAAGLLSAQQQAQKLNAVDQQRLQAQAAALRRQIELERGVLTDRKDQPAKDARVAGLEAQLIEVQSRIRDAASKGRQAASSATLEEARAAASDWAQIWLRASNQVRDLARDNAASVAARTADPVERARLEAEARTAATRQQLAELQRDLQLRIDLSIDPQQRTALLQQLDALGREGAASIAEATRSASLGSIQAQVGEVMEALRLQEAAVDAERLSVEDAEQRKFAARAAALPQLQALLQAQLALAQTPGERNAVQGLVNDLAVLQDRSTEASRSVRENLRGGFAQFFSDVATGSAKALTAFGKFVGGVARSALDLIGQRLGMQLADSLLPKGGGGVLSSVGTFFASLFHSGGLVGSSGGAGRSASPLAWLGAPRYHTSGIVGLKPRERAIIAEDGEEVLDASNPRHIRNFRGAGGTNISIAVHGAQGPAAQQNSAAAELGRMVEAAVDQWAAKQSRVGGVLSRRGS